jgi:hypothetical protein
MKYFRDELLILSGIEEEDKKTDELWKKAMREYKERFNSLKGKIPSRTWRYLDKTNLHDLKFNNFTVLQENIGKKRPINIILRLSDSQEIVQLEYSKVHEFKFIFNESDTGINYLGVHECVYSELLDVNDRLFSHELLFSTGATLYIEFEKIKLTRVHLKQ